MRLMQQANRKDISWGYEFGCEPGRRRGVAGFVYVDLVVTPASVLFVSGQKKGGIAGETLLAGQTLYIDAADANKLKLADANVTGKQTLAGVSLHAAASGQPITYQETGVITIGATVVVGTVYDLSATPGGIAPDADSIAGWKKSIVGVGTSTTQITLGVNNSGALIA